MTHGPDGGGLNHTIGTGDYGSVMANFNFVPNNIYVINCEYNTNGATGGFYVNNELLTSFSSLSPNGTTNTFFGAKDASAEVASKGPRGITGYIYEIIIIDRLITSSERTNIYDYLNYKWLRG